MRMTEVQIRKAILDGKIAAITLDTNQFDRHHFQLERGSLALLGQFKSGPIRLLLSEIVVREVKAHMRKKDAEADSALKNSLISVGEARNWSKAKLQAQQDSLLGTKDAVEDVEERLQQFLANTATVIVSADDGMLLSELVDRYFSAKPPFAVEGKKKYEFPDAIALLGLESWARKNNASVLVVSGERGDNDWRKFCNESSNLVLADDLLKSLTYFQNPTEQGMADHIAKELLAGNLVELHKRIIDTTKELASNIEVSVEAYSQFLVEEDDHHIEVKKASIAENNGAYSLEVIEYGGDELIVRIEVDIIALILVEFSFSTWDSVDRETLSMGGTEASTEEEYVVEAIVTLNIEDPNAPELVEIELAPTTIHVEFSDAEPDWMNQPDDYDLENEPSES